MSFSYHSSNQEWSIRGILLGSGEASKTKVSTGSPAQACRQDPAGQDRACQGEQARAQRTARPAPAAHEKGGRPGCRASQTPVYRPRGVACQLRQIGAAPRICRCEGCQREDCKGWYTALVSTLKGMRRLILKRRKKMFWFRLVTLVQIRVDSTIYCKDMLRYNLTKRRKKRCVERACLVHQRKNKAAGQLGQTAANLRTAAYLRMGLQHIKVARIRATYRTENFSRVQTFQESLSQCIQQEKAAEAERLTDGILSNQEDTAEGLTGTRSGTTATPLDADVISIRSEWDEIDEAATLPSEWGAEGSDLLTPDQGHTGILPEMSMARKEQRTVPSDPSSRPQVPLGWPQVWRSNRDVSQPASAPSSLGLSIATQGRTYGLQHTPPSWAPVGLRPSPRLEATLESRPGLNTVGTGQYPLAHWSPTRPKSSWSLAGTRAGTAAEWRLVHRARALSRRSLRHGP